MSTIETITPRSEAGRAAASLWARAWVALRDWYMQRRTLQRTRLDLFALSDAELRDIGLSRAAADREAARSLLASYLNNSR